MPRANLKGRSTGDRVIRFKCSLQNTILDVLRARPGWQEVTGSHGDWDFLWCDKEWAREHYDCLYFPENSRVSHFRNFYEPYVTGTYDAVKRRYRFVSLQRTSDAEWDIYWCDVWWMRETFDHAYLDEHMKINHFRNHYELTRKNLMVKNLKRLRRQIERESGKLEAQKCDFFPTTYELPSEYHIFVDEFRRNPGSIWIMKPIAKSQGKGIFLFKRLKDITDWKKGTEYQPISDANKEGPETYVVQRYIENPYLIGGRKFDIRVYVLVTSYNPLRVWLYRDGFARFSNTRFSLESIENNYVHLTNVAIQKTAPDYDPEKGCKWSTQQLRQYLTARHKREDVEKMLNQMQEVFILSLQSTQKIMINDKHCFELYGYDILLDAKLKPWLLEINASPSLTASSKEDYDLKFGMLNDVINVLDMENRLTGKEKRIGGFDFIWDDGPVYIDDSVNSDSMINSMGTTINSFLGCHNERRQNLKQIYQTASVSKKP